MTEGMTVLQRNLLMDMGISHSFDATFFDFPLNHLKKYNNPV